MKGFAMTGSDMFGTPGQKISAVGIPWYREADYAAIRAMMTGAKLPDSYAFQLARAGQLEREIQQQGRKAVRAIVDPHTFPVWCHANGFAHFDANARIAFAAQYAMEHLDD